MNDGEVADESRNIGKQLKSDISKLEVESHDCHVMCLVTII